MESAEVLQDHMKTRSSWFPWVERGESVRSNVEKKSINSDECRLSGWMLKSPRTASGVPSSGEAA